MLQKFMDMGVFIYTMTGIGVAGILMMFLMSPLIKKEQGILALRWWPLLWELHFLWDRFRRPAYGI